MTMAGKKGMTRGRRSKNEEWAERSSYGKSGFEI
jgi:hypothetical protein